MKKLLKSLKSKSYYWLVVTGSIVAAILTYNISAASTKDATKFVNDLSDNVMSIMKHNSLTDSQKEDRLSVIFTKVVDTDWIGKFALGRNWNTASAETQQEYLKLFKKYLVSIYVPNFKKYTSQKLQITRVNETAKNEFLVQTLMIDTATKNAIKIDYRMIQKNEDPTQFLIFDIIGEGISLIATQRSEFTTVISREGFSGLIDDLKNKTKTK